MPGWPLYLIAFICALAAVATLTTAARKRLREQLRLQRRLASALQTAGDLGTGNWLERNLRRLAQRAGSRLFAGSRHEEMQQLLRQAGLVAPAARNGFLMLSSISPLLLSLLLVAAGLMLRSDGSGLLTDALIGLSMGYLLPRWGVRHLARRRRSAIAREVPYLLQFLLMLFEAGLSVEHALRVLRNDTRALIPNLAAELDSVLGRIVAGEAPADALQEVAAILDVSELTDSVAVLQQLIRHGGGARDSLGNLINLFEDRERTAVQEKVSKISAKMSIVMMLFLFPALLVLLAGPGMVALLEALGGIGG